MSAVFIETGNLPIPVQNRSALAKLRRRFSLNAMIRAALRQTNERGPITAFSELASRGLTNFQLARNETKQLIEYLHEHEHIKGAIHGHVADAGSVLVVATDERLLYLHALPDMVNFEEIPYDILESVVVDRSNRLLSCVCIQTQLRHYHIDYVNPRQAEIFAKYLESKSKIPRTPHLIASNRIACSA